MKILHTSDWHLGRTLYSKKERQEEHAAFLAWLLGTIRENAIDLLLIAGDVYRPAAADQLQTLGDEIGVRVYRGDGRDPVAIAREGIQDAIDNLRDVVIVDTAGRLHVDDDGPGIPVSERARLLQPFERLEASRNRSTGGFGLGLAITAMILRAHGGQVMIAESDLGGARITLEWPTALSDVK